MGLSIDSRKVKEGDAFFCIIGNETDGHLFIDSAIDNGAKAIIHSREIPEDKKRKGCNTQQGDTRRKKAPRSSVLQGGRYGGGS